MQKDNLTFIRTALALGVLCFHAFGAIGIEFWQFAWVPAFIAISGFLITQSLTQSHSYRHFAWKRVLRIGPAFLVSLALVSALGGSVVGALVDWLSVLLAWAAHGVNPPLWSLSLEEVLYFCLALLFALGVYRQRRTTIVTLLGLCALLAGLAPWFAPAQLPVVQVAMAFVCGSLLYVLRDCITWSVPLGLACLGLACIVRNLGLGLPAGGYALLMGPLLAYGLITLAFHAWPLFGRFKQAVGDPSLGIYLYHYPILVWLQAHGLDGLRLVTATLALTLLAALLSWHGLEKWALRLKDWRPMG